MAHIQTESEWQEEMSAKIVEFVRHELYMELRYLKLALSQLQLKSDPDLRAFATDGAYLYVAPEWLIGIFEKNAQYLGRAYLCGHLRMLYFQIYVNGKLLKEYHADGIIIATPTGSTGYNMSAGGPLVEPGAQMILLTPVCPHTLQTRSIVLRADDEIIIRIIGKAGREETGIEACFDGARNVELAPLDEVRVTKSIKTTSIIKISEAGFLDVLHRKMSD